MENRQNSANINWYPGHMAKTKREIKENIDLIDIVYEVIDARIPKSSKNKDVDELIKTKPRILIMTNLDLSKFTGSQIDSFIGQFCEVWIMRYQ
jgi:ribosome biogenesis GTPase A